jgi:hypothetical protein
MHRNFSQDPDRVSQRGPPCRSRVDRGAAPKHSPETKALYLAAALVVNAPALAQPIPGSEGWLVNPLPGQGQARQQISKFDVALMRCYRAAIATGQFFLGDVNFVLGRCQRPLGAWTNACERREGRGAPICLLGPQQAVGEALRDAWAHRSDLRGWLASLPPLPDIESTRNASGDRNGNSPR